MTRGNAVGSQMQFPGNEQLAYMAGFLDGDGCIAINYEKHSECRLGFRVRVRVSFTQSLHRRAILDVLHGWIGSGSVSDYGKHQAAEYVIRDQAVVEQLLSYIRPYLIVKRQHSEAALHVLRLKKNGHTVRSLEQMRILAEFVRNLNRYPKRTDLDPVTTDVVAFATTEKVTSTGRPSNANP